jgi:hypothetical protein
MNDLSKTGRYWRQIRNEARAIMQSKVEVAQSMSDVELLALLCRVQDEIEAHREPSDLDLLLADFAKELLRQRLLTLVKLIRVINVHGLD